VAFTSEATVTREWNATWTTRPPSSPWIYPDAPSVILVGLQPIAPVQLPYGGGCWLSARPDTWLIPTPSSPLTQQIGTVRASVWIPSQLAGVALYLQMLSADTRTLIGFVTSPLLVVTPQYP
jgi:hypothetical protein